MFKSRQLRLISIILSLVLVYGCNISVKKKGELSEVEQMYNQEQYKNAMNVARYNLSKDPKDPASIVTVWKIQVLQGTKSIEYAQQFYFQAKDKVAEYGEPLIPYLGKAIATDPHNSVRLFCLYCLTEFQDTLSSKYIAQVYEPDYKLGDKASNVTLDFMRSEASMALGAQKYTPAFDGIIALTKSPDSEIRAKAAMSLGLLGDQRAIPVLEELAKEKASWVAEMADTALAKIKRGE
ncbi:MAG TPA: HEAT repeat domain-containing protein [archaeon]|nr:HEAT repeat domain-containing protein [archaeon]